MQVSAVQSQPSKLELPSSLLHDDLGRIHRFNSKPLRSRFCNSKLRHAARYRLTVYYRLLRVTAGPSAVCRVRLDGFVPGDG
jgi:hypothetical protein